MLIKYYYYSSERATTIQVVAATRLEIVAISIPSAL